MLVLTRKYHEKIRIGENIVITVLKMKGKAVRLGIEAPDSVAVLRGELVFDKETSEGNAASESQIAAQPRARAGSTRTNRIPGTEWTHSSKPAVAGVAMPGHIEAGAVLHQRVPRRRISQMMPPILGCDPSRVT